MHSITLPPHTPPSAFAKAENCNARHYCPAEIQKSQKKFFSMGTIDQAGMRKHLVTWIKNVPSTLETCYGECLEMVGFFCHPLSFIYFLYKSGNTKTTKAEQKTEQPLCSPGPATCLRLATNFCRIKMLFVDSEKCPKAHSHSDVSDMIYGQSIIF